MYQKTVEGTPHRVRTPRRAATNSAKFSLAGPSQSVGVLLSRQSAYLTAAASLNQWQWLRSMLAARFRPDVHNQRRLAEHCGSTPAETLDRFRAVITSTTAPSSHTPAYLGEVVVHAQDIRQPLGLVRTPSVDALTPVADFFARRDFTVASRTHVTDLQLRADDGPFATGTGPLVTGSTLALVMSMAGRVSYVAELDGPGVPTLRSRLQAVTPAC